MIRIHTLKTESESCHNPVHRKSQETATGGPLIKNMNFWRATATYSGKSNEIYMMRRPGYQEYTAMMMMMFRFSYSAIYTQTHDSLPRVSWLFPTPPG